MNDALFFSVVIPVHNKLPHLERSVGSVLGQTYQNFELILVDDASDDGSSEKLGEFKDPRIRTYRRTVAGPGGYAARNLGIEQARHSWICFLDADDEWAPSLLATLRENIQTNPQVECVTWGYYLMNNGQRRLDKTSAINAATQARFFSLTDLFRQRHTLWTGAVAMKKDLLLRAGKFPETGYKRGGDVDTWIRCLWHSRANLWLNQPMSYYYQDSVNMVTRKIKRESLYIFSPFVQKILTESKDRELVKAIREFQNNRIYSILRGQILEKQETDYSLIKKMNINPGYFFLLSKLLMNRLIRG